MLEKINEQFCLKVHNIITSSNFLIYEGKSFLTAALISLNGMNGVSFYCFTASSSPLSLLLLSTSSLSRPNNLQLVSKSNNNNSCATTLWERQNTHSLIHSFTVHAKEPERERKIFFDRNRNIPEKVSTSTECMCVCQFPSFLLVEQEISISFTA